MKMLKRTAVLVIALLLTLCQVGAGRVLAANYTYTVRISAGGQGGSIDPAHVDITQAPKARISQHNGWVVVSGVAYGERINLPSVGQVYLDSASRYYVRGFRLAARDYEEKDTKDVDVKGGSFTVTKDTDVVVSYGIKGDMAAYTVNYVDADGNKLHESETFYGKLGDKPVVAYRYTQGYVPQSYNLTKTLSANEAANVFTFTYKEQTKLPASGGSTAGSDSDGSGSSSTSSGSSSGSAGGNSTGGNSAASTASSTSSSGSAAGSSAGTAASTGGNAAGGTTAAGNAAVSDSGNGAGSSSASTGGNASAAGLAGGNAADGASASSGSTGAGNAGSGNAADSGLNLPEDEEPAETIDLDESKVPTGDIETEEGTTEPAYSESSLVGSKFKNIPLFIGTIALALVALGSGAGLMVVKKKEE